MTFLKYQGCDSNATVTINDDKITEDVKQQQKKHGVIILRAFVLVNRFLQRSGNRLLGKIFCLCHLRPLQSPQYFADKTLQNKQHCFCLIFSYSFQRHGLSPSTVTSYLYPPIFWFWVRIPTLQSASFQLMSTFLLQHTYLNKSTKNTNISLVIVIFLSTNKLIFFI